MVQQFREDLENYLWNPLLLSSSFSVSTSGEDDFQDMACLTLC